MPVLGFGVYQLPADQDLTRRYGVQHQSWGGSAERRNGLFTNPALARIGEAHGKSVAQVALRRLIQREVVTIPKSVDPDRMARNFDVFDLELTGDQRAADAALVTGETLSFDHHDPEMVAWLSKRRLDG